MKNSSKLCLDNGSGYFQLTGNSQKRENRYFQFTGNSQKRENRYFQLTGDSEKTLKSLLPVDWKQSKIIKMAITNQLEIAKKKRWNRYIQLIWDRGGRIGRRYLVTFSAKEFCSLG